MSTELEWVKSSYSGSGGDNCIEVAVDAEAVHVRDSKDLGRDSFAVAPGAWAAFTAHVSGS
ncbi:DUF397 domain-containing protein [Streptomyces sp. P38-E01]|uniref:DUF397 domain-containing protein n=1 Tax=Streptomyces tardus TaxID=2780544 RepID=A0A949NAP6_9ACTN|nr:DUF397 domain-containing protein [Streptomyces tardus]MBU7600906.1 DUF397 domain-containing protein [Streptomyces tardus]